MSINGTAIAGAATSTAAAGATAINDATGATGVTAVAYNTYKGAGGASGVVNGLQIGSSVGTNATVMRTIADSGNMTELVNNINRDASGVTATLNSDNSITLSNDTGEDIIVGGTTLNSGLKGGTEGANGDQKTYKGYIALTDQNSAAISITATKSTDKNALGVAAGTDYTAADVSKWGLNVSTGSTNTTGQAVSSNAMAVGDLVLNGVSVGASTGATAGDKAVAINLVTGESGVKASANTEVKYTVDMVAAKAAGALGITINGSAVDFQNATSMDNVVSAINGIKNGVAASVEATTGKLVISSVSGQDIKIEGATAGDVFGQVVSTSLTTHGTISLTSDTGADIKVAGSAATSGASALAAGFVEQGGSSEAIGQGLSVSSLANANNAINRIDDALDKVAVNRSELGAVQNRLDSTISNLQNASENFSAANGRILDADFAKETADMSKQQILMQAGVAMLAQAKQLPQQVLQLLQ
jgi:flagellin